MKSLSRSVEGSYIFTYQALIPHKGDIERYKRVSHKAMKELD